MGDSSTEIDNESNALYVTVDQGKNKRKYLAEGQRKNWDGHRREVIHEEKVRTQHFGF